MVLAGKAEKKRWWRHFVEAESVEVWVDGQWHSGTGVVRTDQGSTAAEAYRSRYRQTPRSGTATLTFVVITFPAPLPPTPVLRGRALARAWFLSVTLAEFVGFAVHACVGVLTVSASSAAVLAWLLVAGAVEGAMLGLGQAAVLVRALPVLSRRRWVIATAGAAALSYLIGLVPSLYAESVASWPLAPRVAEAVVLALCLLASIGTAQWLVLRHHVEHAALWIVATAVAWAAGLGAFLGLAMPQWQPGQPLALTILVGIVGGLLMAAITSAITGIALRRMLRNPVAGHDVGWPVGD